MLFPFPTLLTMSNGKPAESMTIQVTRKQDGDNVYFEVSVANAPVSKNGTITWQSDNSDAYVPIGISKYDDGDFGLEKIDIGSQNVTAKAKPQNGSVEYILHVLDHTNEEDLVYMAYGGKPTDRPMVGGEKRPQPPPTVIIQ